MPISFDAVNVLICRVRHSFNSTSILPPRTISVPRPAILVAIVTARVDQHRQQYRLPLMLLHIQQYMVDAASLSSVAKFRTLNRRRPTSNWPRSMQSKTSSMMALYFSGNVRNIRSVRSSLTIDLCVARPRLPAAWVLKANWYPLYRSYQKAFARRK